MVSTAAPTLTERPSPRRARAPKVRLTPKALAELLAGDNVTVRPEADPGQRKIINRAASMTWADDYWELDRERNFRKFQGTNKRRCRDCGRDVPPQDRAAGFCCDCRTRAPAPATARAGGGAVRATVLGDDGQAHEIVYESSEGTSDASPMAPALRRMDDGNVRLFEAELPTEDELQLACGVEAYLQSGDLAKFDAVAGDRAAAEKQAREWRQLEEMRPIVV